MWKSLACLACALLLALGPNLAAGVSVDTLPRLSERSRPLTQTLNSQQLSIALNDPDDAFDQWARRNRRPYVLNTAQPTLSSAASSIDQHHHDFHVGQQEGLNTNEALQVAAREHEYMKRKSIWLDNLKFATDYNAKPGRSHWLGMTSLADLTLDEFRATRLGFKQPPPKQSKVQSKVDQAKDGLSKVGAKIEPDEFQYNDVDVSKLPKAIDWRAKRAVSEVKNQQQCGSCWAFATTGAIEGVNAIATGELVSLSEQELVDCDREIDMGCNGGMMDNAYSWVIQNGGIDTEADWPYVGEDQACDATRMASNRVVSIDGYQDVPEGDEVALKKAVAHQPVAVAIEADSKPFQLYMGGVFEDGDSCGSRLNHGVLVVGFGEDEKEEVDKEGKKRRRTGGYWIVKNSWSDMWGDQGYIKIRMGYKDNMTGLVGMCGITLAASFPTKTKPNPPHPEPHPPGPKPKPSPPEPVACDSYSSCPSGSTCCCVQTRFLFWGCGQWGCCPIPNATCCEDKQHCCPEDLPVCDSAAGRCLPKTGVIEGSIPWLEKQPATSSRTRLQQRQPQGEQQQGQQQEEAGPRRARKGAAVPTS